MKRIKYIFIVIDTIVCLTAYNQNLVLNPSFEEINCKHYPQYQVIGGELNYIKNWIQATNDGSVDHFSMRNNTVPSNHKGDQKSRTGDSYIGESIILRKTKKNYREYFEGEFSSPLDSGKKYEVSFYVSLADLHTSIAVSGMGAYLSKDFIIEKGHKRLDLEPQVVSTNIISNQKEWVKVSGVYESKGGEKYIIIGNFTKYKDLKKLRVNDGVVDEKSYYFIDDVSVVEIPEEIDTIITDSISFTEKDPLPIIPKLEEIRVLENVQFPTNKWVIDTSSYKTLNKLYNYLVTNPFVKIQINGYTDNRGREDFNLGLSEKRAKAVVDYLISKGISETRLNYKGYGVANPIGDNETEEGRSKNRRIEIEIKENGADVLDIVPKK